MAQCTGGSVDPTGRTGWDWAQTRIGQVVLFWGVLQLILRTLDALTRSDMLLMLRRSLAPDLQWSAGPRVALFLVAVAILLLWGSNRPRKSAKSLLNLPRQPETKDYSLVEVMAIPFFLAFVCGVGLAAFESSSPNHGQLARLTLPSPTQNLPSLPQRRRSEAATSASAPAGQPESAKGTEPLVRSLPALTPAIDRETERAGIVNGESRVMINPSDLRLPLITGMSPAGQAAAKSGPGASQADVPQKKTVGDMERAHKEKNWPLLASLCEDAMAENPQWLTPYLFAGEAYANLGQVNRAVDRLDYVRKNGAGNPEDRLAVEQATQLRESIRQRYGR